MEAAKHNLDLTEGVIWKKFLLFLLPIAIGTLFQQFYSTVDAVIVGITLRMLWVGIRRERR